jgi:hypothetical protein
MTKKKTYVVTISEKFPSYHPRKGQPTHFYPLILRKAKKHTIRGNYDLWAKRFEKIDKGEAILSVRQWSGKPYQSPQIELMKLDCTHGIGLQKLIEPDNFIFANVDGVAVDWEEIAINDGLSFTDFCDWFSKRTIEPMAIIHFSDFRYKKNKP